MERTEPKRISDEVRDAALRYITPGGIRKVVRRPKTDVESVHQMLPFKGGFLSTRVWGKSENKTVLLVHGWAANQTDMFLYVPSLLDAGFKVVAMDLPAHGESSFDVAGLNHLGDAVLAVGNAHGQLEGVIAHSVGCAATQLAIASGLRVGRVVILASPNDYEAKTYGFAKHMGFSEEQISEFIAALREFDVRVEIRSVDFVPNFDMPVLIVHSEDDAVIPISVGEQLAAYWKNSIFLRVNGLNHRGVLRDKFVIESAIKFLADESFSESDPYE